MHLDNIGNTFFLRLNNLSYAVPGDKILNLLIKG